MNSLAVSLGAFGAAGVLGAPIWVPVILVLGYVAGRVSLRLES